jgi:tripartite-type tricarboxylate transporter receptor subunit TctC
MTGGAVMRYAIEARRRIGVVFSIAAALWMCPLASWAQTAAPGSAQGFPSKLVRYVVPFGAGASPDIVGRLLADRLTRLWGQQVIVDNRVGAAGVLGTAFVAKSTPDGHTLVQCNIASSAITMSLFATMPYDQLRDLAAVTRIGMTPNIVTTHPSVPIRSIQEFIVYARAHPGKLSYSSGLAGTSPQLSMELVKLIARIDVVNIPYRVGAQAITDTIGGQVPINISNFPATVAPVQAGRLRALAVTSASRATQLPAVPTLQEAGLPGYDVQSWQGLCAPAGTPAAVLDKLHADLNAVLRQPEVRQRLDELVMVGAPTSREEFAQFIRAEIARWAKVIKDANIPQQ